VAQANSPSGVSSDAQALIEELLRTALWLFDVTSSLLDELPEDAFPNEDPAVVMVEMLAGSCRPAIEAAGEAGCRTAIGLAIAIRENIRNDLQAVARSASNRQVLL
jgi:hypothetical protein